MQHLLDFIHSYSMDPQLYLVVTTSPDEQELELFWRGTGDRNLWEVRVRNGQQPAELVQRTELLPLLARRGVDMARVERELHAIVSTQIAVADTVLSAARTMLGRELVRDAVLGSRAFADELRSSVEQLIVSARPVLSLVAGGGEQTVVRSGHLSVVHRARQNGSL